MNRIKILREEFGYTQQDLADRLDGAKSTIAMYENETRKPSLEVLVKLSNVFDCSIDYLLGKSDIRNPNEELNIDDLIDEYNNTYNNKIPPDKVKNLKNRTYEENFSIHKIIKNYAHSQGKGTFNTDIYTNNLSEESKNKVLFIYGLFLNHVLNILKNFKVPETDMIPNVTDKTSQYYLCPVYGQISAGQPNWAEECIDGYLPIDPNLMNIVNPEECFFLKVNGQSMDELIKDGAFALIRKTDFVENGEIAVVLVDNLEGTLKKFSKQGDLVILEPMSSDPSFTTQVYGKDTNIKVIGKYIGKMEIN